MEGHPGVGTTDIAKVLARALGRRHHPALQCYEGLDAATALYEWNYPKQLLHIKLTEGSGESVAQKEATISLPSRSSSNARFWTRSPQVRHRSCSSTRSTAATRSSRRVSPGGAVGFSRYRSLSSGLFRRCETPAVIQDFEPGARTVGGAAASVPVHMDRLSVV